MSLSVHDYGLQSLLNQATPQAAKAAASAPAPTGAGSPVASPAGGGVALSSALAIFLSGLISGGPLAPVVASNPLSPAVADSSSTAPVAASTSSASAELDLRDQSDFAKPSDATEADAASPGLGVVVGAYVSVMQSAPSHTDAPAAGGRAPMRDHAAPPLVDRTV